MEGEHIEVSTYNNFEFNGVAPHSLVLGGSSDRSDQSVLQPITPQTFRPSCPITAMTSGLRSSDQACLCEFVQGVNSDGTKCSQFSIYQPEIKHVIGDLPELWQKAHALRVWLRDSQQVECEQNAESTLALLDHAMRSTLEDMVGDTQLYSIILLSYGAPTTIQKDEISYNAYLDYMVPCPFGMVLLVFENKERVNLQHHMKLSELPKLREQGIQIDSGPLYKFSSESIRRVFDKSMLQSALKQPPPYAPPLPTTFTSSEMKNADLTLLPPIYQKVM